MARGGLKGGKRHTQKIRELQREGKRRHGTKVEVGFFDPRVATIARQHEYGTKTSDGTRLPERPAFRAALPAMQQAIRAALASDAGKGLGYVTDAAIEAGARDALEAMVNSYMHAPGPPVGERQAGRKAGTPGAGRLLVGREGPKLISWIEAEIDGRKVD